MNGAQINVIRILQAMKKQGWGVAATATRVGVNNKTLTKILNGEMPRRLDAFNRVMMDAKYPLKRR